MLSFDSWFQIWAEITNWCRKYTPQKGISLTIKNLKVNSKMIGYFLLSQDNGNRYFYQHDFTRKSCYYIDEPGNSFLPGVFYT